MEPCASGNSPPPAGPCGHVTELIGRHLADIEQRLAELRKTRTALRDLAQRAARTDPEDCGEDGICTILSPY
ncbi:MerR family DNA-binding protein [Streptomyces sp. NPDC055749]